MKVMQLQFKEVSNTLLKNQVGSPRLSVLFDKQTNQSDSDLL